MPQSLEDFRAILPHLQPPKIQSFQTPFATTNGISTHILRLDEVHPIISGNKIFKLWYFLREAIASAHKTIITFGGAWSNHLAAAAFCCQSAKIRLIGIIRGEAPKILSPTLQFCINNGMQPVFVSREEYRNLCVNIASSKLEQQFGAHTLIPEGGYSPVGACGAALICRFVPPQFTHVITTVGTATTLAGLALGNHSGKLIGIPVLKGLEDIPERLNYLGVEKKRIPEIIADFHFGGYAKKSPELINFMNRFYEQNQIELDFVYTAKMMFALDSLLQQNFFPPHSKILALHTGGLQGNESIKEQLVFNIENPSPRRS